MPLAMALHVKIGGGAHSAISPGAYSVHATVIFVGYVMQVRSCRGWTLSKRRARLNLTPEMYKVGVSGTEPEGQAKTGDAEAVQSKGLRVPRFPAFLAAVARVSGDLDRNNG